MDFAFLTKPLEGRFAWTGKAALDSKLTAYRQTPFWGNSARLG